eukprot:329707_1
MFFVILSSSLLLNVALSSDNTCSVLSTGEDIPGPFYLKNAPNRITLYDSNDDGIQLQISGKVTDLECVPLSNVYIDFWQANPNGEYDKTGFKFRGGLYTNENGEYELYTLTPGTYSGRPVHIHVKLFIDDEEVFTTQIYFDGYIGNDLWFDQNRAIILYPINQHNTSYSGTFNFVGDWKQPQTHAFTTTFMDGITTSTNTEPAQSESTLISSTNNGETTDVSTANMNTTHLTVTKGDYTSDAYEISYLIPLLVGFLIYSFNF